MSQSLRVPFGNPPYSAGRPGPTTPPGPRALPGRSWWPSLRRAVTRAKADRTSIVAGSLAYHGFVAIIPALVALIAIASLTGISGSTVTTLVHGVGRALPAGASGVLSEALEAAQRRTQGAVTAVVLALVISLWSASSAMSVLQTGLDVAYGVAVQRRGVARRLMALVLMAVVGLGGVVVGALVVFGQPLGQLVREHLGVSATVFVPTWTVVRWVVTVLVAVAVIGLVYRLGPHRPAPRWRWLSPGGVLAAGGWLLLSLALSYYVSSFGHYGRTYGALAGVVVLMLWLYLSSYAVLFGAQWNAEIERSAAAAGVPTGAPVPAPPAQPGPPAAAAGGAAAPATPSSPVPRPPDPVPATGTPASPSRQGAVP